MIFAPFISSHRRALHLFHAFLILLVSLYLILGGVSGPTTGFWWITVQYTGAVESQAISSGTVGSEAVANGNNATGAEWNLGSLGACVAGQVCKSGESSPTHWYAVHALLSYHLAVGTLFPLISFITTFLILRPPPNSLAVHWWTFLLPFCNALLVLTVLASDFGVLQALKSASDISSTRLHASFWLSTLAIVAATLWAVTIQYIRFLSLRREPVEVEEQSSAGLWRSLWPFGKGSGMADDASIASDKA